MDTVRGARSLAYTPLLLTVGWGRINESVNKSLFRKDTQELLYLEIITLWLMR